MLLASAATGALAGLSPDRAVETASRPPAGGLTWALLDPPKPPQNLRASAGDGLVDLNWDASDPLDLVTGYKIFRGVDGPGSEKFYDEILLFTSYRDSGVVNGNTYWYYVKAVNAIGDSAPSNEDSATPGGEPPPPQPTVPDPPQNLNAVAGVSKVDLTWEAPGNNGGSPITDYHIYRGPAADQVSLYASVGGHVLRYTDTGVTNGQTYWYRVSAENNVGEGEKSNAASATPEAPATRPGPPVDLRATPGDGSVQLDWSEPTDKGGAPITKYNIYRGTTSGQLSFLAEVPPVLTYLDTTVTNGRKYFYQVSANNSVGEGPRSTEVSATPLSNDTVPDPPTDLVAIGGNARVSLSWQAPGSNGGSPITNYKLYRGPSAGGQKDWLDTVGADTLSYVDTRVTNGVPYYYQVKAVNIIGESGLSNEASATPTPAPTVPDAVRNLTAEPIDRGIVLRWQPPANSGGKPITNYKVYRGFSAGDRSTVFTIGNVTTHTDLGLQNGKRYYYVVAARNEVGDGPPSNEASAVPATSPTAPRNLRAFAGDSVVTLQWSGPLDNGGSPVTNYRIYRGTVSGILNLRATVGPIVTFRDDNLLNDQTYYYQVSAVNRAGEGNKSAEVSATPHAGPTVPGAPPTLIAAAGNGSVRLTWSRPANDGGSTILRYSVYRDIDPDNLTFLANAGSSTDHLDGSVTNGVTYYYEVAAVNAVGEGPRSPLASATPHEGAGEGPDLTRPTVTITNPPPDADDLTAGPLDVYGTARDDISVMRVEVSPDGATWTTAIGTAQWSARIILAREGLWTIQARVVDSSNNTGVATVTVSVKPGQGPGQQGGPVGNPGTMMVALAVGSFAVSAAVAWFILDRRRRFWKSVLYGRGPTRSLMIDESLEEPGSSESGPHPLRRNAPDHRLRP